MLRRAFNHHSSVKLGQFFNLYTFENETEEESRTLLKLSDEINTASKLFNDHLADDETKANTFHIDLVLLIFDWTKQFEYIVLIFLFNTYTSIFNSNYKLL